MFKESRLIFKLNKDLDQTFDKASEYKIDAEEVVSAFHNRKNQIESKEDIGDIKVMLLAQMDDSLKETNRIIDIDFAKAKLEELKQDNSPERRAAIKKDINNRQTNVKNLIRILNTDSVVILRNGLQTSIFEDENQRQNLITEFIGLTPEQQIQKLKGIKQDIEVAIKHFHELVSLLDPAQVPIEITEFKKLNADSKKDRLKEIKQTQENYKKLLKNSGISQASINAKLKTFATLGTKGQKLELARLTEALNIPHKDKEFLSAKKHRQEKYPDFQVLAKEEKEEILRAIRSEIKTDYQTQLLNHKHFSTLSKKDIEMMLSTFNGRFKIDMAEMCLDYLNSSMDSAAEIQKQSQKYPVEVLNHFKWDQITCFEKKKLLEPKGLVEIYAENLDHIKYDAKYHAKLLSFLNFKPMALINQKGFDNYFKWFQSLSASKKKEIVQNSEKDAKLDDLEATKQARINANKKFLKLPKQIQKEYLSQYSQADFEGKIDILQRIEKEDTESVTEFNEKLDELIEQKLLSPKSRDRYFKWFTKKLNLSERDDYLKNCNLDKKERKQNLEDFQKNILPFVPEEDIEQVEKEFYNSDYKKRKKLVKKYTKLYIPKDDEIAEIKQKTLRNSDSPEEEIEKLNNNEIVKKDFLTRAQARIDKGDRQGALVLYEEVLEMDLNSLEKDRITNKVKEIKEEEEHYESLESGHFNQIVENEISNIFKENPVLKKQKQTLAMLEEAYDLQYRNEVYYEKTLDTGVRMHDSLDDQYTKQANEAFSNYTEGKQSLYIDAYGDLEVGETVEFDITTFDTEQNLPYWMDYFSDLQEVEKSKRLDPRFQFKNGKTGQVLNAKQFDNEILYPARTELIDNSLAPLLFERLKLNGVPSLKNAVLNYLYEIDYSERLPKSRKTNLED